VDEDNSLPSDGSSISADTNVTEVENENGEGSDSDRKEENSQAPKLYRHSIYELYANPNETEVEELLQHSDDDEEDKEYSGINSAEAARRPYLEMLRKR